MGMKREYSEQIPSREIQLSTNSALGRTPTRDHLIVIPPKEGIHRFVEEKSLECRPAYYDHGVFQAASAKTQEALHLNHYSRILAVITRISAELVPPTAAFPTTTF